MDRRWWTALLAVVSALLVGNAVWHFLAVVTSADPDDHFVDVVMIGGSTAGGLAVAVWHARRDVDSTHQRRTVAWLVASVVLFVAVGTVTLFVGSARVTDAELVEAVQLSANVGAFLGLLVGRVESRALENARAAAGARAEAEALDAVVDSAVADLRTDSAVTVDTPGEGPAVRTSETVEAALSLVCEGLVILDDDATVAVRYEPGANGDDRNSDARFADEDRVRLTVESPGGELPVAVERAPFEAHGTGVGLRLYLARELLGEDGDLAIDDAGGDDDDSDDDGDGDDDKNGVRIAVVLRQAETE
jgi:hypothetical protein